MIFKRIQTNDPQFTRLVTINHWAKFVRKSNYFISCDIIKHTKSQNMQEPLKA